MGGNYLDNCLGNPITECNTVTDNDNEQQIATDACMNINDLSINDPDFTYPNQIIVDDTCPVPDIDNFNPCKYNLCKNGAKCSYLADEIHIHACKSGFYGVVINMIMMIVIQIHVRMIVIVLMVLMIIHVFVIMVGLVKIVNQLIHVIQVLT